MKFLIVSGNPKTDGLCHSVMAEVLRGATDGGADVAVQQIGEITRCHVCNDGYGGCHDNRRCGWGDDGFDDFQDAVEGADAVCFITPVYWHETAEGLKCAMDRLRRCCRGADGALAKKPALLVASAGGTGNGIVNCLHQMDQFCKHTYMQVYDFIGVNRWNADYKRQAAYAAAKSMASGRQPGETLDK